MTQSWTRLWLYSLMTLPGTPLHSLVYKCFTIKKEKPKHSGYQINHISLLPKNIPFSFSLVYSIFVHFQWEFLFFFPCSPFLKLCTLHLTYLLSYLSFFYLFLSKTILLISNTLSLFISNSISLYQSLLIVIWIYSIYI